MTASTALDTELVAAKPVTSVMTVTADTAARWLAHNTKNRTISPTAVERYRRDIEAGRWVFAADPIRFSAEGRLLDGQHRLTALSQVPDAAITLLVVRGLQDETQMVMDQGRKRTPGDQLGLEGIRNANNVAAGVKVHIIWREGFMFRDSKQAQLITAPQVTEWVNENSELVDFCNDFATALRSTDAPASITWAAALAFAQIDEAETLEFFNSLAHGGRPVGHPINTLDKRLQRLRREGIKMSSRDQLSLFILAWNAWRDGRTMVKFQRPRGGSWTAETFPEPK